MYVNWPLWGIHLFTTMCAVMGFMAMHSSLWEVAYVDTRRFSAQNRRWFQIGVTAFDALCLMLAAYAIYLDPMSERLYQNLMLVFAAAQLYDDHIPLKVRAWRWGVMLAVIVYNVSVLGLQWPFALAMTSLIALHAWIFLRYEQTTWPYRIMVLAFVFANGGLYWFGQPYGSVTNRVLGVLTYTIAMMFTYILWLENRNALARNSRLRREADFDVLTNARSYARFHEDIEELVTIYKGSQQPLSMLMLDIDHFKAINDNYGHLSGNAVLVQVAKLLKSALDATGMRYRIYRTGGEEFNLVFPGSDVATVLPVARELWRRVRTQDFAVDDQNIKITLSMGLTELIENGAAEDLFKRADQNLYRSKRRGRDTITVEGETLQLSDQQAAMYTYSYFAQPIVSLETGKTVRYELLLRMYDDMVNRWRLPQDFNVSVTTQVSLLQRTLRQLDVQAVNINLLPIQFANRRTAITLGSFAEQAGLEGALSVELTELPELEQLRELADLYHKYGVKIVIDDVGSDNSFVESRDLLPYVDGIKFAMQNLRRDHEDDALRSKIEFWRHQSKIYGLDMVLEGVETKADEALGQALGIPQAQGYYYGRPVLPEAERGGEK